MIGRCKLFASSGNGLMGRLLVVVERGVWPIYNEKGERINSLVMPAVWPSPCPGLPGTADRGVRGLLIRVIPRRERAASAAACEWPREFSAIEPGEANDVCGGPDASGAR